MRPDSTTTFWSNVDQSDGCWLWTGTTNGRYGTFKISNRNTYAHRFSYELHCGPIPPGMDICHRCDVPLCVNPSHLFVGTRADNMQDAARKGRVRFGSQHGLRLHPERAARGDRNGSRAHPDRVARGEQKPNTKLTEDTVRAMRKRYAEGGISYQELSILFGVSAMAAYYVVTRKTWQHVD